VQSAEAQMMKFELNDDFAAMRGIDKIFTGEKCRYHIVVNPDGRILVDTAKLCQNPK
jgi:hypothetical protein